MGGSRTIRSLGLKSQNELTDVGAALNDLLLLSWPGSFSCGLSIRGRPEVMQQISYLLPFHCRGSLKEYRKTFSSLPFCRLFYLTFRNSESQGGPKKTLAYKNAFIVNL